MSDRLEKIKKRLVGVDKQFRSWVWMDMAWLVSEVDRLRQMIAIMDDMASQKNDLARENERLAAICESVRRGSSGRLEGKR